MLEQTKPQITAQDIEAIITWIKNNIMTKLPADASATYHLNIDS